MSKKTKGKIFIFLWKVTIILCAISLILTCMLDEDEKMQLIFFFISMFLGIMMHVIAYVGEKYVDFRKVTTALKYQIKIKGYNDISYYLSNDNYERDNIKINENIYGDIYYKVKKSGFILSSRKVTLIVTINMKTYDAKTKDLIMNKINDWLVDNLGERNDDYLEVVLVLCLDSINDKFKNYINQDIYQSPEIILLPVGIVLDNSTMYIRVQKEAFLKGRYKKLKKKFIDTINDMIINT